MMPSTEGDEATHLVLLIDSPCVHGNPGPVGGGDQVLIDTDRQR